MGSAIVLLSQGVSLLVCRHAKCAHSLTSSAALYGQKEGCDDAYLFHWEEGAPCPACGTPLVKIRTGSTGSYICPGCQKL